MLMVLAMDTREGPDPEDKAEFLMAATVHLLEVLMASYHPPGIPDVVTSGPYDSFGRLHQQCVHDPWRCGSTLASSVFQCHHLQHMCIVLAWEAREGPNTQGPSWTFHGGDRPPPVASVMYRWCSPPSRQMDRRCRDSRPKRSARIPPQ